MLNMHESQRHLAVIRNTAELFTHLGYQFESQLLGMEIDVDYSFQPKLGLKKIVRGFTWRWRSVIRINEPGPRLGKYLGGRWVYLHDAGYCEHSAAKPERHCLLISLRG
jgi:hypothetical protein